jgi:hypothetical protein
MLRHDAMRIAGQPVPAGLAGELRGFSGAPREPAAWRAALAQDGYILLRGALDRAAVLAARAEVFGRLREVGEIAAPAIDGIATGTSQRAALHPDPGPFWRSVCEGPRLRAVSHGPGLGAIAAALLGCAARPFDFLWLRTMLAGRASPLHFDRFADLVARYRGLDVDRDTMPGSFPEDAVNFAASRGARLLTADFAAGDVMLFDMFSLHGSCDNMLDGGRVRLSCDVRWQPAGDAGDDRWFGAPPPGHGGRSYGGVNSARPLGADYIAR